MPRRTPFRQLLRAELQIGRFLTSQVHNLDRTSCTGCGWNTGRELAAGLRRTEKRNNEPQTQTDHRTHTDRSWDRAYADSTRLDPRSNHVRLRCVDRDYWPGLAETQMTKPGESSPSVSAALPKNTPPAEYRIRIR